eukprot:TRINITY_DN1381_c0_g2_i4.p2 TRINITY_DN1381_c0_g2~~TRINITY_DN1381_c0_g2_i4.p2  ORF type:complete len:138 (-),score=18.13 TRINITY_DN1381_c0_g2_i4:258-671(-)
MAVKRLQLHLHQACAAPHLQHLIDAAEVTAHPLFAVEVQHGSKGGGDGDCKGAGRWGGGRGQRPQPVTTPCSWRCATTASATGARLPVHAELASSKTDVQCSGFAGWMVNLEHFGAGGAEQRVGSLCTWVLVLALIW